MHETTSKGDIGVARATSNLIENGFDVLSPINSSSPFDLVVYKGNKFWKIQVKYIKINNGTIKIDIRRNIITNRKITTTPNLEVDVICAYCPDTQLCYYIKPIKQQIILRINPPEIKHMVNIKFAKDYLIFPED